MKKKKSFIKFLFFILTLSFIGPGVMLGEKRISNVRYEIWVELDDQNKMLHGKENITWLNKLLKTRKAPRFRNQRKNGLVHLV